MRDGTQTRAVVLGGSLAGLFAARVLSDVYDEVVIVDRDVLVGVDGPRRGCPQSRHISGLLTGGQRAIEKLYPGITDELFADGVPKGDLGGTVRWYFNGKRLKQQNADMLCVGASRPVLERHIRERTAALTNIRFLERHTVLGLETTADRSRVRGARVQSLEGGGGEEVLDADLVVDATGRGSRTPVWLEEMGYPQIPEERKKIGLGYVSQHYRLKWDPYHGDLSINPVASPAHPRGAIFARTDGDRVEMTTYGILGDHPPTDQAGLFAWLDSLGIGEISDALRDAEPLEPPVAFRFPTTLRRHYENMERFPYGLLVTGDAVCCFNPVYAGGMTVAAKSAHVLRNHLHTGADPDPAQYFRELARDVIDAPWEMTNVVDLSFPGVEGERPLKVRMAQKYLARVQAAATRDGKVTAAYMRSAGQIDSPDELMRPGMVARVLWQSILANRESSVPSIRRPAEVASASTSGDATSGDKEASSVDKAA